MVLPLALDAVIDAGQCALVQVYDNTLRIPVCTDIPILNRYGLVSWCVLA
jgi:hypothetical protein